MPFSDFVLTPDDNPEDTHGRPARLVTTGLAPTSALPVNATKGQDTPPCLLPCVHCGVLVLQIDTPEGIQRLAPPEHGGPRCYVVAWERGASQPWGTRSGAMAQHRCRES